MYETVRLWIMGDFWKTIDVKWERIITVQGFDDRKEEEKEWVSIPIDARYFIFIRFAKGCYTLERISDFPHYMEGGGQ